jgi:hypothetical protein
MTHPVEIPNVSRSVHRAARFFGMQFFRGELYIYDPARDVLVRADVAKARAKESEAGK